MRTAPPGGGSDGRDVAVGHGEPGGARGMVVQEHWPRPRPGRVPAERGDRRRLPGPPGRDPRPPFSPDSGLARHRAQNLLRLASMETPRRDLSDLRTEAVAGLAELDVREVARMDLGPRAVISGLDLIFGLDFSPDGRTLIGAGYAGSRFRWDWAGDHVTALPDDPTMASAEPWSDQAALPNVRSHPSGDYLAATTGDRRVTLLGQSGRARVRGASREQPAAAWRSTAEVTSWPLPGVTDGWCSTTQ